DDQMCRFGTFMRSVAQSEEKSAAERQALNAVLTKTYTNLANTVTHQGKVSDLPARLERFRERYCNPADNNFGLEFLCDWDQDGDPATGNTGAQDPERMNKDIDFARTVSKPLHLEITFSDDVLTADEEDVIALARNLYWPSPISTANAKNLSSNFVNYMDLRQLLAFLCFLALS
ncbi:MAG: hypothetical protein AAF709_14485, partial [Pseudomonadota bacterium]